MHSSSRSAFRIAAASAAAAALVAGLAACAAPAAEEGTSSLTIAVATPWPLDPLNYGATIFLDTQPVYEALLVWDQSDNTFIPWLVEDFEMAEDRRSLTMNVRDGITFTDGTPLTAETIKDSFDMLMASEGFVYRAQLVDLFKLELSVEGDGVLVLSTAIPMTDRFMRYLVHSPVVSPVALEDAESIATTPVGTGPYLLDEEVVDVSRSYVRNPDYWNPDAFAFDSVEILYIPDAVARLNALKSGQVDVTDLPSALAVEASAEGLALHEGAGWFATLIVYDRGGENHPAFADVRVREAINYAFDREAINESLNLGYGRVDTQPFGAAEAYYVDGAADRYPYDLERARELMADAGFAEGFSVIIPTHPGLAGYQPIVQQSLGDIGIAVEFEQFPAQADMEAVFETGQYPLMLSYQPYINTIPLLQAVGGYTLLTNYIDPELQSLIEAAEQGSLEESREASPVIGERILDLAWFTTFSHASTLYATQAGIEMVVGDLTGVPRLYQITQVP